MSDAFEAGGNLPSEYTCDGEGISPPLYWRAVPEEAQSLALIVDDPDAGGSGGPFAHWVVYDMPADTTILDKGAPPPGEQGRTNRGTARYEPPCPPRGPAHHYHFRFYALDRKLNLGAGATRLQVLDRMEGHILAQTELIGLYKRQLEGDKATWKTR